MFAFVLNVLIVGIIMWVLLKFMYPKPPKAFAPKEGEDIRLRACSHCGHKLATYRGILENGAGQIIETPAMPDDDETKKLLKNNQVFDDGNPFFCNDEHRQAFYDKQNAS